MFQSPYWQQNYPQKFTSELISETLLELGFNPSVDEIHMCTGNIFDDTRKMLKDRGIRCMDTKIEGILQTKVEQAYLDHLKVIGVNANITIESGKERFFQLFHWVAKDFHKRQKYVKSGFQKWEQKWEGICLDEYHKNIGRNGPRNDDGSNSRASNPNARRNRPYSSYKKTQNPKDPRSNPDRNKSQSDRNKNQSDRNKSQSDRPFKKFN